MSVPVLGCGSYLLNLQCPECGSVQEVAVYLDTRLTVDAGGAKLAAKLNGKPVDHLCGQLRLVTVNGAAPPEEDPELFRPPDHAERASGAYSRTDMT